MKKVSIIIVCFNEEKYIEACLNSLEAQDYKQLEILIGDDGSTDTTVEIIKKHNVKLFTLNHQGTAYSRNFAAQKATGDILVFLDADMEFEPDFISHLVTPILAGTSKGTFSKLEYVKNWNNPLARCWNKINPTLPDKMRISQNSDFGDDFRAILASEFKRVGGFDNVGYTDTWSLHKKLGYKATAAPNAKYYHYNPDSYTDVFNSAKWIGKRNYKWGIVGKFLALLRSSLPVSVVKGMYKAITTGEIYFIPFYITYDVGITAGILSSLFFNDNKK